MQALNLAIAGYGIYGTIISSYYWFSFGKNVGTVVSIIYILVMIALHWDKFIYRRHIDKMVFDRLAVELGYSEAQITEADNEIDF